MDYTNLFPKLEKVLSIHVFEHDYDEIEAKIYMERKEYDKLILFCRHNDYQADENLKKYGKYMPLEDQKEVAEYIADRTKRCVANCKRSKDYAYHVVRIQEMIDSLQGSASSKCPELQFRRIDFIEIPRITDSVIWVTGNVDEKMAQTQLADIVLWLNKKAYWENRIATVEVKANHEIVLKDKSGLDIIVGHGQGFESKMNKLRVFEEQMAKVGGKKYKTLDIRYKDQVIGKE